MIDHSTCLCYWGSCRNLFTCDIELLGVVFLHVTLWWRLDYLRDTFNWDIVNINADRIRESNFLEPQSMILIWNQDLYFECLKSNVCSLWEEGSYETPIPNNLRYVANIGRVVCLLVPCQIIVPLVLNEYFLLDISISTAKSFQIYVLSYHSQSWL